jgi:peptidoglycan-associated lipoprotein
MNSSPRYIYPVAIFVMLALGACSTPKPVAPPSPSLAVVQPQAKPSIIPGSIRDFQVNVGDTVHFDYNRYDVQEPDKSVLQRQAAWLNRYSNVRIIVQGNCDERGTREYNIALGARRSNSVKDYLVSLGISAARVETVSYGKERPICSESNEACWGKNRRAVTDISSGATT